MKTYNKFCERKKCKYLIVWDYYGKTLTSCKKIGESENIDKYPDDCFFLDEIKQQNKT